MGRATAHPPDVLAGSRGTNTFRRGCVVVETCCSFRMGACRSRHRTHAWQACTGDTGWRPPAVAVKPIHCAQLTGWNGRDEHREWRKVLDGVPLSYHRASASSPNLSTPKCIGAHVARAARLEPKTPPGLVYASEAFAALEMLNPIRGFRCDYVKQLDWAKRYGTFPAYVVRRH